MTDLLVDAALPPTGLAVLALLLLLLDRRRSAAMILAGLVLLSTDGAARLLFGSLALPETNAPLSAPGAIVILPADTPGLLDTSRLLPGMETLERLRAGALLARQTGLPILVSGARAAEGDTPVATAMAASLREDFQTQVRWEENRSRSLGQSAIDSAALLHEAGITTVFLVTQPWDVRLASVLFHAAGIEVATAPVRHPNPTTIDSTMLLAFTPAWLDSALALRQWAGLACQAVPPCARRERLVRPDPS